MDLSKLSDQDFQAFQSGDLTKMSDAGFAQLMVETQRAKPMAQKVSEAQANAREQYNPTKGMSAGQLLAAGGGKAVSDLGTAVKQALGMVSRKEVDQARELDKPLMNTTAGKSGYVLGTGALAVPVMMSPGANTLTGATLYGAGLGAATPVGEEDSVLKNSMFGALGGAAGYGLATGTSRMLSPRIQPEQKALVQAGVQLTPGQRLGGAWKRAEDAMTSLPGAGDFIRSAQRKSFENLNASIANDALQHVGAKVPTGISGRDLVKFTQDTIGGVYDSVLARVGQVQRDQQLLSELTQLRQSVKASMLPKEVKAQFESAVKAQIDGKFQGQGVMLPQTFKTSESELGRLAARYGADPSADKQLLGDALQEAQAIMRRALERSSAPDIAADAKAANAAWAKFVRLQKAAGMQVAREGVFSPEQYNSAVRAMDQSVRKGGYARGDALGQNISDNALAVMGSTVPDSGTPFRTLVAEPIKGAVSMAAAGLPVAAMYNPVSQRALAALMSGQRPALATKLAAEMQALEPALTAAGISFSNLRQRNALQQP